MKKLLFIIVLFAGAGCVSAQKVNESDVPAAVKTTFKSKCPGVTGVKWEKEDGNYEGHYSSSKTEMTCVIDPNGKFVQSEVAINASGLPKGATDYLAKNLSGKKVSEAAKITEASGKVTYEAEVDDNDYIFDEGGNFLKKEVDSD